MLSRRSGAISRFLIYRAPERWALLGELFFFNVLFGFLPLFGALYGFVTWGGQGVRDLLDPRDPIHSLARPLPPGELARGARRWSGRVTGGEACVITHEHFNKGWVEDWADTDGPGASLVIERADGPEPPGSPAPFSWRETRWVPRPVTHESGRESYWRRRQPGLPSGGRVMEGCLHPGDRLFVDVSPDAPLTVLTPGDGTPRLRIAQLAASYAGQVSVLVLALVLALLYLWRLVGARPYGRALVQRLAQPLVPLASLGALAVLVVSPAALWAALWCASRLLMIDGPVTVERWGWLGAHFAGAVAVITAISMSDRRADLGAALDLARRIPRLRRGRAREGEACAVEATIDPAAPLDDALLTGAPHVHWVVTVTRIYHHGKSYASEVGPARNGPLLVPISTADGGAALLDLTHAAPDLRAIRRVVRPRAARRSKYQAIIERSSPADSTYVLEERFLDRGEPIHVLGRVLRFATVDGHQADLPVIGGSPGEPVVVHAGSRRSFLRGLIVERAFLTGAVALSVGVALALAALAAYLTRLPRGL